MRHSQPRVYSFQMLLSKETDWILECTILCGYKTQKMSYKHILVLKARYVNHLKLAVLNKMPAPFSNVAQRAKQWGEVRTVLVWCPVLKICVQNHLPQGGHRKSQRQFSNASIKYRGITTKLHCLQNKEARCHLLTPAACTARETPCLKHSQRGKELKGERLNENI